MQTTKATPTENPTASKLVCFDWAIKYLLRNKANFDILEGFLSELLHESIIIENILESEGNKETQDDKFNRVDVLVKTQDNKHIIVEVQCYSQWDFLTRILYGTSKLICEHMSAGDDYHKVSKVISVSIVFFDLGMGKDYLYHGETVFTGIHCQDTLSLNEKEQEAYQAKQGKAPQMPGEIYPEHYIIKVLRFGDKVKDKVDEWIYFLKKGEIKQEFTAKGLQSASDKLNVLKLDKADRRAYESYQNSLRDEGSFNLTLEAERHVAHKKGREQGREEGREEGIQQGELTLLKRLLQHRFGTLSSEHLKRLDDADRQTLIGWSDRVLDVTSADEIFNPRSGS